MFAQSLFIPLMDKLDLLFERNKPVKPNVYVVGYGWGGKAFYDNIDKSKFNVTVINKTDKFLNTPKLVNFNDLTSVEVPINVKGEDLIIDEVTEFIPNYNAIIMKHYIRYYDYLVIATGSQVNTFGIEGAETCQFYKTVDDAKKLKESLKTNNSYQIIGAGPTGIEVAFELAAQGKKVTLIEAANKILPSFNDAVREKVLEKLKEKNIELFLNQCVKNIDSVFIETQRSTFPRQYTLWMAGIKPPPLVSEINKLDGNLKFNNNIYVIGDSIRGHGPPTAQNAKQQGIYLANHFNNKFKSEPYKYNEWCKLLHTHDSVLVDYNNKCYTLPSISSNIFEHFLT